MTDKDKAVDPSVRREKDDALLAAALAELNVFEKTSGKTVEVHVNDSNNAGNCMPGVVEWRKAHAGGRESVPAREMLQIAAECRDQVSRVVLGVRRAIQKASAPSTP